MQTSGTLRHELNTMDHYMSFTRENASGYTPDLSPLSNPPSNYLVPSNLENQPSFSNGVELNPSVQGFWTFNKDPG